MAIGRRSFISSWSWTCFNIWSRKTDQCICCRYCFSELNQSTQILTTCPRSSFMDPVTIKIKSMIHQMPNPPIVIINKIAEAYRLRKNLCAPKGQESTKNNKKVGRILFSETLKCSFISSARKARAHFNNKGCWQIIA